MLQRALPLSVPDVGHSNWVRDWVYKTISTVHCREISIKKNIFPVLSPCFCICQNTIGTKKKIHPKGVFHLVTLREASRRPPANAPSQKQRKRVPASGDSRQCEGELSLRWGRTLPLCSFDWMSALAEATSLPTAAVDHSWGLMSRQRTTQVQPRRQAV